LHSIFICCKITLHSEILQEKSLFFGVTLNFYKKKSYIYLTFLLFQPSFSFIALKSTARILFVSEKGKSIRNVLFINLRKRIA
jgi:hypothetical protein